MNLRRSCLAAAIGLLAAQGAAARPAMAPCEVSDARTQGELQARLSRLAVEAIRRAGTQGRDSRLEQLVAPSASFSLGAGDVGRPLGTGTDGARALARIMKADRYRFLEWTYIPTPVADPCAAQKVEVEFTDSAGMTVYPMSFTFDAGRIVAASGWTHAFESGPLR